MGLSWAGAGAPSSHQSEGRSREYILRTVQLPSPDSRRTAPPAKALKALKAQYLSEASFCNNLLIVKN